MASLRSATRDNVVAFCIFLMLIVTSWTSVQAVRTSSKNNEILKTVQRCVLPEGDLCKGSAEDTQKVIDAIVKGVLEGMKSG